MASTAKTDTTAMNPTSPAHMTLIKVAMTNAMVKKIKSTAGSVSPPFPRAKIMLKTMKMHAMTTPTHDLHNRWLTCKDEIIALVLMCDLATTCVNRTTTPEIQSHSNLPLPKVVTIFQARLCLNKVLDFES